MKVDDIDTAAAIARRSTRSSPTASTTRWTGGSSTTVSSRPSSSSSRDELRPRPHHRRGGLHRRGDPHHGRPRQEEGDRDPEGARRARRRPPPGLPLPGGHHRLDWYRGWARWSATSAASCSSSMASRSTPRSTSSPSCPVNLRPTEFIITGVVAIAVCLVATIFPALYAARPSASRWPPGRMIGYLLGSPVLPRLRRLVSMRWFVDVSSVGKGTEKQSYCVDADSWQRALQARARSPERPRPDDGFSIELLDDGFSRGRSRQAAALLRSARPRRTPRSPMARPLRPRRRRALAPPPAVTRPATASAAAKDAASRSSRPPPLPTSSCRPSRVVTSPRDGRRPRRAPRIRPNPRCDGEGGGGAAGALQEPRRAGAPRGGGEARGGPWSREPADLPRVRICRRRASRPRGGGTDPPRAARDRAGHDAAAGPGKLVNLAVFNVRFKGRPSASPIATLSWKDWRGEVTLSFPTSPPEVQEVEAEVEPMRRRSRHRSPWPQPSPWPHPSPWLHRSPWGGPVAVAAPVPEAAAVVEPAPVAIAPQQPVVQPSAAEPAGSVESAVAAPVVPAAPIAPAAVTVASVESAVVAPPPPASSPSPDSSAPPRRERPSRPRRRRALPRTRRGASAATSSSPICSRRTDHLHFLRDSVEGAHSPHAGARRCRPAGASFTSMTSTVASSSSPARAGRGGESLLLQRSAENLTVFALAMRKRRARDLRLADLRRGAPQRPLRRA